MLKKKGAFEKNPHKRKGKRPHNMKGVSRFAETTQEKGKKKEAKAVKKFLKEGASPIRKSIPRKNMVLNKEVIMLQHPSQRPRIVRLGREVDASGLNAAKG